ncbi:MAG: tripartite tricarboxylate transporter substrate binding protein [Burkholderiaceae bacterium]
MSKRSFLLRMLRCIPTTLALFALGAAQAQTAASFPAKPVRIVVPAPPGSSADLLARLVGQAYGQRTGQPWVVDNRPGAGGLIGSDLVAKAAPDGYTLLLSANNIVISPSIYPNVPYDVFKDFAPVGMVASTPNVILVNATTKVTSMAELVAMAKRSPSGLDYGSPFVGSSAHLVMEMLARSAAVNLVHIPAKGTPQAFVETLAGRVPVIVGSIADAETYIKAGSLTPLAMADARRSALLPQVPTLAEAGYAGLDLPLWFALFAPARTPSEVVAQLNSQLAQVLALPNVAEALKSRGFTARTENPVQLEALMQRELPRYAQAVREAGVKP